MATNWQLGQTYSFSVYPEALLGTNFANVTVMALMDAATAAASGLGDIYAEHANLYSSVIGLGTVKNDATSYYYLKLKLSDSSTPILLGIPFIIDSTVNLVTAQTITAVIGQVSSSDLINIKNLLAAAGYNSATLTISGTLTSA